MKQTTSRNWSGLNSDNSPRARRNEKFSIDQSFVMGGLAILIFSYIIFRFIFPLIEKDILW